jgi:glycerol-3-phosphate acyltransferase PlsY
MGCFSTAYYFVRLLTGQDVRTTGSGNAGARNAGRILGRQWFVIILLIDIAKGVLAVSLARLVGVGAITTTLAAAAVVAGHIWPAQLRFRGGMGIASSIGAMLIYNWAILAATTVLFVCAYLPQRLSGRSSRRCASVSAGAAVSLVFVALIYLGRPPIEPATLSLLATIQYAGYRTRLAAGWPSPES